VSGRPLRCGVRSRHSRPPGSRWVYSGMLQILRNKNLATRFQILVEVAANQPNLQQKDIARRLGVTSQAISEYVKELVKEGWLVSEGRSKYRVTQEGMNWVLQTFRELRNYSSYVGEAITNVTVCAAVADQELSEGQSVGLEMRGGLLVATTEPGKGARGIAVGSARQGEDVGVSFIEGIVQLVPGRVTVLRVPDIKGGGSRSVDMTRLKQALGGGNVIGVIGIEAITALRRIGVEPRYLYGVADAAIEAARSGLSFVVVCSGDYTPALLTRLSQANLEYELLDVGGS